MTEGKLVGDLIRESGRRADVRYVSDEEVVSALAVKLRDQACCSA